MKKLRRITAVISILVIFTISVSAVSADSLNPYNSYSELVTLPTEQTQSIDSDTFSGSSEGSQRDYALFYTQTTLLALVAGYLIIFKLRCINPEKEKMHDVFKNKTVEHEENNGQE